MKDRPILFSGPMVRAILDGRKTQTRRVIKPQPVWVHVREPILQYRRKVGLAYVLCPYGQPGDRLWCRETWAPSVAGVTAPPFHYLADFKPAEFAEMVRWKPSIYMPRWASRITIEITAVRVERVCQITEQDALAEGVCPSLEYCDPETPSARMQFKDLWNTINSARGFGWDVNPWVWVVSFKRL